MSSESAWSALPRGPTLFGKLPQKRDFVRIRHDYPAALAFDSWLQDGLAELADSGLGYGDARVRFLFAQEDVSLVGILHASRDRAGRAFPVSIFAPVPSVVVGADAATLWLASGRFFADSERVLATVANLAFDDLAIQLDGVATPSRDELAAVPKTDEVDLNLPSDEVALTDALDCPAPDFRRVADFCRVVQQARPRALSVFWALDGTREPGRALLCSPPASPSLLARLTQGASTQGSRWTRL